MANLPNSKSLSTAVGSLAFAACILLAAGCHRAADTREPSALQAIVVKSMAVGLTSREQSFEATGTVSADLASDISTRTSGRVLDVRVREGDRVRKGQTLIVLDASDVDASIAQAKADVTSSDASYSSAVVAERMARATAAAQIASAEAQVQQAQAALGTAMAHRDLINAGPRMQERAVMDQNVARANAALVIAQKTYDRLAALYRADAVSRQQLDVAKSDLDGAEASYQSSLQSQSMTNEGSRAEDKASAAAEVRQAQASLSQAQTGVVQAQAAALQAEVKRADIDQARAQIGKAKASLGAVIANRSYSTLVAPFDGVVAQRFADPGAMAGQGVPLLRIQSETLRLDAVVPETALDFVHVGSPVLVMLDALGAKPLKATVASIAPQGDSSSHTFVIKARLPDGSAARAGMYGRARIATGSARSMAIPADAAIDREGLTYAFVISDGVAKLRLISVIKNADGTDTVQAGLVPGNKIAAHADGLTDNSRVTEAR